MSASDLEARWPAWPEGEEGKLLLDVVLDLPVDTAFLLLFGGLNDLSKTFNEAAGNKEYSTTGWMEGAEAVQAAAAGPTPPPLADVRGLRAGMLRRASYSGTMMGSKYRNEELHRLQEASPGAAYRVLTTVMTTAMHGEKFRPVVQSSLGALPEGRCEYRIRSVVRFVVKPNGFIRAMIDKGARDGQRKNFDSLRRVLEQHARVWDAADVLGPPAAPVPEAAEAPAVAPAGEVPPPAGGLLEAVAGSAACRRLEPWAAWLHGHLAAAVPPLGELVGARALLGALAALCLLSALRVVVDMLAFIHHASAQPRDTIGLLTHYLFKVVDVPDSMQEVLLSCLVFYTVRLLVNRLADALPPPPAAAAPRRRAVSFAAGAAGGGGGGLAGAPSAAASGLLSGLSGLSGLRSEDQEAEGIKYEGYAEAIAALQALSPSASGTATPERPPAGGAAKQPGFSMKGFSKSISDAFTPGRSKKVAVAAGTAAVAGAAGALSAGSSPPEPPGLGALSEDDGDSSQTPAPAPGACSAPGSPPSAHGPSPSTSPAAHEPSPLEVPRSLSESAAAMGSLLPTGVPAALAGAASPTRGALPPGAAASPPRSLSPGPRSLSPGPRGVPHSRSQGALAEGGSKASLSRRLRGVLSPGGTQPGSPGEPQRRTGDGGPDSGALSPDQMLSPTAALRDFRPSMPAHLEPALAGQAVIEEVFENQRLQPFRGWGHTWPGHFLPTDKVNHWSRREHEGFPVLAGPDFAATAPPLPEGWQWCEESWHLDLSGQIIDACDDDGWSYGLDFGYVRHPFQQGSGRKKVTDFVRRRRWIRTRVPLALAAQPRTTTISEDAASWLPAGGGGGAPGDTSSSLADSVLAQLVEESEVQASMHEALTRRIGSRSNSGERARPGGVREAPRQPPPSEPAAAPQLAAAEQAPEQQGGEQAQQPGTGGTPAAGAAGSAASPAGLRRTASYHSREASVSFVLSEAAAAAALAGSPPEAAAAPAPGFDVSFSSGACADDQLTSPSEQLRGFERSPSHAGHDSALSAAPERAAADAGEEAVPQDAGQASGQAASEQQELQASPELASVHQAAEEEEVAEPVVQVTAASGDGQAEVACQQQSVSPGASPAYDLDDASPQGTPAWASAADSSGDADVAPDVAAEPAAGSTAAPPAGEPAAKPASESVAAQLTAEVEVQLAGLAAAQSDSVASPEPSPVTRADDALHLVAHR